MRIDTASRTAMVDAAVDRIDVGAGTAKLQLRTGSAPANITDAAAGTLLAEFSLPNPAFGNGSSGVATANAISDTTGLAAGTVGHYRVVNRNGDCVSDSNDVGTSGTALVISTLSVSVGLNLSVTSWTRTQPAGTP